MFYTYSNLFLDLMKKDSKFQRVNCKYMCDYELLKLIILSTCITSVK